jgi:hypothetical protein
MEMQDPGGQWGELTDVETENSPQDSERLRWSKPVLQRLDTVRNTLGGGA